MLERLLEEVCKSTCTQFWSSRDFSNWYGAVPPLHSTVTAPLAGVTLLMVGPMAKSEAGASSEIRAKDRPAFRALCSQLVDLETLIVFIAEARLCWCGKPQWLGVYRARTCTLSGLRRTLRCGLQAGANQGAHYVVTFLVWVTVLCCDFLP